MKRKPEAYEYARRKVGGRESQKANDACPGEEQICGSGNVARTQTQHQRGTPQQWQQGGPWRHRRNPGT
eukprot:6222060-Prymnesium_polylepis.1